MDLQARLYACAVAALVAGMLAAVAIWFTAGDDPGPAAYQIVVVDGKPYPIAPGESKRYVRDLQQFGGKAGVLFDELNRWFAGLWRGRSLAVTVGWIAAALSVALFLLGWIQPDAAEPDEKGDRTG
jgi:hypothetical protein